MLSQLRCRFAVLLPHLNERQRRLAVAAEAGLLGHGGVRAARRSPATARPPPAGRTSTRPRSCCDRLADPPAATSVSVSSPSRSSNTLPAPPLADTTHARGHRITRAQQSTEQPPRASRPATRRAWSPRREFLTGTRSAASGYVNALLRSMNIVCCFAGDVLPIPEVFCDGKAGFSGANAVPPAVPTNPPEH